MLNLAIPLPISPGKQDIEIEMSLGGKRHKIHYRVELYPWKDCSTDPQLRVNCIRDLLKEYNEEWEIYDIGEPTDDFVPLTFINRDDWIKQRTLLRAAL